MPRATICGRIPCSKGVAGQGNDLIRCTVLAKMLRAGPLARKLQWNLEEAMLLLGTVTLPLSHFVKFVLVHAKN